MRQVLRTVGFGVIVAAALAGGWLRAQSQAVTACGTILDTPGNYELTGDLGPCAGNAVTITADNVSFDLAGFSISGASSADSCNTAAPQVGITVSADTNVTITGGTVRGFVDGIDFGASNSRATAMTVVDNCVNGLVVSNATHVTVDGVSITGSGNDGLLLLNADDGTFQANTISSNGRFGVLLVSGSDGNTIRDNSLNGNGAPAGGAGLGLLGGTNTQVLRNTVQGNLQGIALHTSSNVVQGNIANGNQTVGITIADVAGGNRVDGNTATSNGAFDMTDVNASCGTNVWQNGVFATDDVAGVPDGGPGAGCITGLTTLACVDNACPSDAKAVLLAQSGAVDVTGPLPELGRVQGRVTVGEVTLEGRGLIVSDVTPLLPGPEIALTDPLKVLNITFPSPVFSAGFDFVELERANISLPFTDTTFLLTLQRGGVSLRQMAFNAPNDAAAFINVVSDVGFDKLVLSPLAAFTRGDVAFGVKGLGRIYAGSSPAVARAYDVLVMTSEPSQVFAVNPMDGYRAIINFLSESTEGFPVETPLDITANAARQIYVVSSQDGTNDRGALFRINAATRDRILFHDFGNPGLAAQGTPLGDNPWGLAMEPTGNIVVADAGSLQSGARGRVFRVNAVSNVRTLVSDFSATAEGPLGQRPTAIAVESSGRLLVVDPAAGTGARGALFRIDPATKKRTLLSDFGDPNTGELGRYPISVAVEASGTILVLDIDGGTDGFGALYRIDPKTGFRFRLSDFGLAGQGLLGKAPTHVAVEPGGTILVIDTFAGTGSYGALWRVDPVKGSRTLVSDFGQFLPSMTVGKHPFSVAILQR